MPWQPIVVSNFKQINVDDIKNKSMIVPVSENHKTYVEVY